MLVGCTLVLWLFNSFLATPLLQQWRASSSYVATEATAWKATTPNPPSHSEDSRSLFRIRYRYQAHGQSQEGKTYWYLPVGPRGRKARKLRKEINKAKTLSIYYDPTDPRRSVLYNDFPAWPTFPMALLTFIPYAFAVALWAAWFLRLREHLAAEQIIGLEIRRQMSTRSSKPAPQVALRLCPLSPLNNGALAAGIVSIPTLIVMLFAFAKLNRDLAVVISLGGFILVIGLSLYAAWGAYLLVSGGRCDLVLDGAARWIEFPCLVPKRQRETLPFEKLTGIDVDRHNSKITFHGAGQNGRECLDSYSPSERSSETQLVADWLRRELEQMGVQLQEVPPEPYPVEDIIVRSAVQRDGVFCLECVGSGKGVPVELSVQTLDDQLLLSWQRSRKIGAQAQHSVEVENPNRYRVCITDGVTTKQIFPENGEASLDDGKANEGDGQACLDDGGTSEGNGEA